MGGPKYSISLLSLSTARGGSPSCTDEGWGRKGRRRSRSHSESDGPATVHRVITPCLPPPAEREGVLHAASVSWRHRGRTVSGSISPSEGQDGLMSPSENQDCFMSPSGGDRIVSCLCKRSPIVSWLLCQKVWRAGSWWLSDNRMKTATFCAVLWYYVIRVL